MSPAQKQAIGRRGFGKIGIAAGKSLCPAGRGSINTSGEIADMARDYPSVGTTRTGTSSSRYLG